MEKRLRNAWISIVTAGIIGTSAGIATGLSYSALTHPRETGMYKAELIGRYEGRTGIDAPEVSLDSLETLARNAGVNVDSIKLNYNLR